jgi:hypothetical protein
MKWQIKGTRKDNGHPGIATVEAATREDAVRRASAKLVIRSVEPMPEPPIEPEESFAATVAAIQSEANLPAIEESPAQIAARMADDDSADNDTIEGFDGRPPMAASVSYANPRTHSTTAPRYDEIVTGANILNAVAILIIIVGIIALVVAFVLCLSAMRQQGMDATAGWITAASTAFWGLSVIVGAMLIRMNASLALAIRDIARNSFR